MQVALDSGCIISLVRNQRDEMQVAIDSGMHHLFECLYAPSHHHKAAGSERFFRKTKLHVSNLPAHIGEPALAAKYGPAAQRKWPESPRIECLAANTDRPPAQLAVITSDLSQSGRYPPRLECLVANMGRPPAQWAAIPRGSRPANPGGDWSIHACDTPGVNTPGVMPVSAGADELASYFAALDPAESRSLAGATLSLLRSLPAQPSLFEIPTAAVS